MENAATNFVVKERKLAVSLVFSKCEGA